LLGDHDARGFRQLKKKFFQQQRAADSRFGTSSGFARTFFLSRFHTGRRAGRLPLPIPIRIPNAHPPAIDQPDELQHVTLASMFGMKRMLNTFGSLRRIS